MIIEKKPEANDIVALKLQTSEEVVGKLFSETATDITLTKPLTAHQVQHENGFGVVFGPFMPAANAERVTFKKSALVCDVLKTRPEIRSQYVKITSGLEIPALGGG